MDDRSVRALVLFPSSVVLIPKMQVASLVVLIIYASRTVRRAGPAMEGDDQWRQLYPPLAHHYIPETTEEDAMSCGQRRRQTGR